MATPTVIRIGTPGPSGPAGPAGPQGPAGTGGGGKPAATANQVANVATGTKTVAQAFADLDAYDYSGTAYTGTLNIPAGYVFTPTDVTILNGRNDCGWLSIISAQFPTAHTTTGTFPTNFLGAFAAILGFIQSTVWMVKVSIDDSGNAGSGTIPLAVFESDIFSIGDYTTSTNAIFKSGPASINDVIMENVTGYAHLITARQGTFAGCSGAMGEFDITGTPSGSLPHFSNCCYTQQFQVTVGNGTNAIIEKCGEVSLVMAGGATQLGLDGDFSVNDIGTPPPFSGSAGNPVFSMRGDLNMKVNSTVWKPLTSTDNLIICSSIKPGGARAKVDFSRLAIDTSATAAYGNFIKMNSNANVTIDAFGPAWAGGSKYDIPANVVNDQGSSINDKALRATATDTGGTGTITPDANTHSLHVTNAATLAALTIDHSNLPNNSECVVYFDHDVTALTITSTAGTIFNAPTAIPVGGAYRVARTAAGALVFG